MSTGELIGEMAEKKVAYILKKFKKDGILWQWGWSEKFSKEDLKGVDFIIYLTPSKTIALQVKSRRIRKGEVKRERLKQLQPGVWFKSKIWQPKKREIFWIEVPPLEWIEKTEEKIKKILEISKKPYQDDGKGIKPSNPRREEMAQRAHGVMSSKGNQKKIGGDDMIEVEKGKYTLDLPGKNVFVIEAEKVLTPFEKAKLKELRHGDKLEVIITGSGKKKRATCLVTLPIEKKLREVQASDNIRVASYENGTFKISAERDLMDLKSSQ